MNTQNNSPVKLYLQKHWIWLKGHSLVIPYLQQQFSNCCVYQNHLCVYQSLSPTLCNPMDSGLPGFSVQPLPSPEDLPKPGIKPWSPELQADSLPSETPGKPIRITWRANKEHRGQGLIGQSLHDFFVMFLIYKFLLLNEIVYLFLAILGLFCYTQSFASCSKRGLLSSHSTQTSHCGGFLSQNTSSRVSGFLQLCSM